MSLNNKIALVTGASSGIGAAIAIKLTQEGARVAIVGRNEKKLEKISQKSEQSGSKPLTIVADVSKDEDASRIVSETLNFFGKLDILVNNAGIAGPSTILQDNAMAVFDKVMSTNLRAVVSLTHLAAKYLIETKGNIVNISSIAAVSLVARNNFPYNTSKAALDHFARSIALELSSKGVRVNTINPGPVKTDIISSLGLNDEGVKEFWIKMEKATALNRVSEPEEIGELVAFLVSDKGRGITGTNIVSDNGTVMMGGSVM